MDQPAKFHFCPSQLSPVVEIGRVHFSDVDEDLDLECYDQKNDEKTFVEFTFLEDGDPALLQVVPVEHCPEEVLPTSRRQVVICKLEQALNWFQDRRQSYKRNLVLKRLN